MKKIVIGDDTIIGEHVLFYDHNHVFTNKHKPIGEQGFKTGAITIGKSCWICSNVVILKGVTIGDHCVISAGSVVREDIPSNSIFKDGKIEPIRYK